MFFFLFFIDFFIQAYKSNICLVSLCAPVIVINITMTYDDEYEKGYIIELDPGVEG